MYIKEITILIVLAFVGFSYLTLRPVQRPIHGGQIDKAQRTETALLVIDMQADFTGENGKQSWPEPDFTTRFDSLNKSVATAQSAGIPVVALRLVYQGWYRNFLMGILAKGQGTAGSDGLQLDGRLTFIPDENYPKPLGDAFSAENLEMYLETNNIGTLILVGLDGSYCLNTTARSALARGYQVEIIDTAIFAQDRGKWEKLQAELVEMGAKVNSRIIN